MFYIICTGNMLKYWVIDNNWLITELNVDFYDIINLFIMVHLFNFLLQLNPVVTRNMTLEYLCFSRACLNTCSLNCSHVSCCWLSISSVLPVNYVDLFLYSYLFASVVKCSFTGCLNIPYLWWTDKKLWSDMYWPALGSDVAHWRRKSFGF